MMSGPHGHWQVRSGVILAADGGHSLSEVTVRSGQVLTVRSGQVCYSPPTGATIYSLDTTTLAHQPEAAYI
jgi:hypothetical protein